MVEFQVGPMEDGKKVHRLVRQLLPGVPLSGIHKMIRTGRVKHNGCRAKPEDVVVQGDTIVLHMAESDYESVRKSPKKYEGVPRRLEVIFEDERVLAVNKPIGLLTHGTDAEKRDNLTSRVLAYLHDQGMLERSPFQPAPANRLDRNTSGVVLFGKTAEAGRWLAEEIRKGSIRKWYLAIVKGQLPPHGEIEASLERSRHDRRTWVSDAGKRSVTRFRVVARGKGTCIVRVELVTGRTHQIRAHFEHLGCPLWGDRKYGVEQSDAKKSAVSFGSRDRQFGGGAAHQWLHAMWVVMPDGQWLHARLPGAFMEQLGRLGYADSQLPAMVRRPDGHADL